MRKFEEPVCDHMVREVYSLKTSDRLTAAQHAMESLGVSALPVLDASRAIAGVLSRTDLLRVGRVRVLAETRERLLTLPDARVEEHMSTRVEVIPPDLSLRRAAKRMVENRHHRLFVATESRLSGVIGTREMMHAVALERVRVPLADVMTSSIISVRAEDPLSLALDRLTAAHIWGLVVVDGRWPLGSFSQVEALAARDASPTDPVEYWMDHSLLCLAAEMTADRAARVALSMRTARIVAVSEEEMRGIVSPLDFARLVSDAP